MSNSELKRTIPIHKVVAAAMVDIYGDISQAGLQQTLMFNAARGFRKLNNEVLKQGRRKVTLQVNKNTHTATLPLDFYSPSFVGIIDCNGRKVELTQRTDLVDTVNVEDIECEDKCPKCAQNKNICKELSITEETVIVIINDTPYEQTIIKELYPNGDYFVITRTPVLDTTDITPETPANGSLLVTTYGDAGGTFELFILGQSLGVYTIGDDDESINAAAAAIAAKFNGVYGYGFTVSGPLITITAAPGLGASLNTGTNITATFTHNTSGGGLGTINHALNITITQFSGGVNASGITGAKVSYVTQKEFIAKISLKDCGCIEETEANINVIRNNCYSTYCSYFTSCCGLTIDAGYEIFPETGLIKFGSNFNQDKVYLEYQGFLPKKNGVYQVPEIAFETLVNWIKFKAVENKPNVPLGVRQWHWERYTTERKNMEKINGRMTIQQIVNSIGLIPKFDITYVMDDYCCPPISQQVAAPVDTCNTMSTTCAPTSNKSYLPFGILTVAGTTEGSPVVGTSTYQDDRLKNALLVNYIIVNNGNESRFQQDQQSSKDFSIDTNNGIISRWQGDGVTPKNWDAGDVLIIPPFF